jgi:hypothetical protein
MPIAHCVSLDFHQGAGLAKVVKERFGGAENVWRDPPPRIGHTSVSTGGGRMILSLVTKRHYWQKPSYHNVCSALWSLKEVCEKFQIPCIVIPFKLSCGLDGLNWQIILDKILQLFTESSTRLIICHRPASVVQYAVSVKDAPRKQGSARPATPGYSAPRQSRFASVTPVAGPSCQPGPVFAASQP